MDRIEKAQFPIRPQLKVMSFEDVLRLVDELLPEQRLALAKKLSNNGVPISVVLGGYNHISNSFVLQIGSDSEKVSEQFKELPPETMQQLVEAIAHWIRNNNTSNH